MKKTLIFFFALATVFSAKAQYTITGELRNVPDGKIVLNVHGADTDSADVVDGHFAIRSNRHILGAEYVMLATKDQKWGTMFWMQNDTITITPTADGYDLSGSKTEDEYQDYVKWMTPVWDERKAVMTKGDKDVSKVQENNDYLERVLRPKQDSVFMVWARRHPSSYIALNHIYNCRGMDKYPLERYQSMLNVLTPGAFEGQQWATMQRFIAEDKAKEPGSIFPDFTMGNAYGEPVTRADFAGKPVLYYIGYTAQDEYRLDLPLRKELYAKYHPQGLEMVDMLMVGKRSDVVRAVVENQQPWTVVSDLKGFYSPFIEAFHIDIVPQTFLVGRDGKIIAHNVYGQDLQKAVDGLFEK